MENKDEGDVDLEDESDDGDKDEGDVDLEDESDDGDKDEGDVDLDDESDDGDKISDDDGDKMEVDVKSKGVGTGKKNNKKKKGSSSSSSSSKPAKQPPIKVFKRGDPGWPEDLPHDFKHNERTWYHLLGDAIYQGILNVCWAVAIAKCIQALLAARDIQVQLAPQHIINNVTAKSKSTGRIAKYDELESYLKNIGVVEEKFCPFTGNINENCRKECASADKVYKINKFTRKKRKEVKEEDVILLVDDHPVVAIIDAYDSFINYHSGVYKGQVNRKDIYRGRHAVLIIGFGTTQDGEHFWLVQNSYGKQWGENGIGKIIRKCSRKSGEPSMLLNVIDIEVEIEEIEV